jgi:2-amino-4-hydroxy-6-hydroxymethyldihydropteridine diphosphokinase
MSDKFPARVYLSLGSNQGDRLSYLINAVKRLKLHSEGGVRVSGVYETEPWGFSADQPFYNIVAEMRFRLLPGDLMRLCLETEAALGRKRLKVGEYESRPIDIDILFYGEEIVVAEGLTVPHPRLHLRRFVLEPMAELAPDYVHPLLNKSIADLLFSCPDGGRVMFISSFPWTEDIV